jgi:hypothetical protein
LQTLYSGKASEVTHLSPGRQWMSAMQKHFMRELRSQEGMDGWVDGGQHVW